MSRVRWCASIMLLAVAATLPATASAETSPTGAPVAGAASPASGDAWQGPGFVPTTPSRLVDTRPGAETVDGEYAGIGPVTAGSPTSFWIGRRGGLPAEAGLGAVVLNVTVTGASHASHLTVHRAGEPVPLASNLNFAPGQTVANAVLVDVSTSKWIELAIGRGSAHVVVDVLGWFAASSDLQPVHPARLLDTRPGAQTIDDQGAGGGPLGRHATRTLQVTGRAGIPDVDGGAVVLNLTGTEPTATTFVTAFRSGSSRPLASNLNLTPGATNPNLVVVPWGPDGRVGLYNDEGSTHLVADVVGWIAPGDDVTSVGPARLLDTRPGMLTVDGKDQGGGAIGPGQTRHLQVTGRAGVPNGDVSAVILNVTATQPSANTYLTVHPSLEARSLASNLNVAPGQTRPNLVVARVGSNGRIALYNNAGSTHVIVDVVGWLPPGITDVVAGREGTCVLAAGIPYCWDATDDPDWTNGIEIVQVALGLDRCEVGVTSTFCNGVASEGIDGIVQAAVGLHHTCLLIKDGTVLCSSQGSDPSNPPMAVAGLDGVVQISTNYQHTCALFEDGHVACWGANESGQVGNGLLEDEHPEPFVVPGIDDAIAVAAGGDYSCVLHEDRSVSCWGSNEYGQLGDGTGDDSPVPVKVAGLTDVAQLAAGKWNACALLPSGSLQCWGNNTWGQLADGTHTDRLAPVPAASGLRFRSISAGGFHVCGLTAGSAPMCWGDNNLGAVDPGLPTPVLPPTRVPGF